MAKDNSTFDSPAPINRKQQMTKDIGKYKGESRAYSQKRPTRKVLSRYAR